MKILSSDLIQKADAFTIKNEPIKSIDLMERAATKCFDWIYEQAPALFLPKIVEESNWVFNVLCGNGNNGGDGLVIARQLIRNGYEVNIFVISVSDKASADFTTNIEKLGKHKSKVNYIKSNKDIPILQDDHLIIDAIFGIGLSRPVEGVAADVIHRINESGSKVISIDMPSGLFAEDNAANIRENIVKSTYILTFQNPKLSFYLSENQHVVGEVIILDIGLHKKYLDEVETKFNLSSESLIRSYIKKRDKFSHKGTFGHALIIAGSKGKIGAAILSAKAALRSGAGLVSCYLPSFAESVIYNSLPEAMVQTGEGVDEITDLPDMAKATVIGIGPGIGTSKKTSSVLKNILEKSKVPLVLDADAINILSENRDWLKLLPENSVLTPHPGEFKKLSGGYAGDFDKLNKQLELSVKYKIFIVLKGAHTSITDPKGCVCFNSTGNPGMATAGAGDVLTGIISGFIASGYPINEACLLAVYIHGFAGDIAAKELSEESLLAGDIIDYLGSAFKKLHNKQN